MSYVTDYNEMMNTDLAIDDDEVAQVDEIQSDLKEELYRKKEEEWVM